MFPNAVIVLMLGLRISGGLWSRLKVVRSKKENKTGKATCVAERVD